MQNLHRTAVGIDLGAKYTGVMIADTVPGTSLRQEDLTAFTVVMPDAEKMMLAQTQRTATRHLELGRGRGISNLDKKARITRPAPLI